MVGSTERFGWEVNEQKTKVIESKRYVEAAKNLKIDNYDLEKVSEFAILGTLVTTYNDISENINRQINSAK